MMIGRSKIIADEFVVVSLRYTAKFPVNETTPDKCPQECSSYQVSASQLSAPLRPQAYLSEFTRDDPVELYILTKPFQVGD